MAEAVNDRAIFLKKWVRKLCKNHMKNLRKAGIHGCQYFGILSEMYACFHDIIPEKNHRLAKKVGLRVVCEMVFHARTVNRPKPCRAKCLPLEFCSFKGLSLLLHHAAVYMYTVGYNTSRNPLGYRSREAYEEQEDIYFESIAKELSRFQGGVSFGPLDKSNIESSESRESRESRQDAREPQS